MQYFHQNRRKCCRGNFVGKVLERGKEEDFGCVSFSVKAVRFGIMVSGKGVHRKRNDRFFYHSENEMFSEDRRICFLFDKILCKNYIASVIFDGC